MRKPDNCIIVIFGASGDLTSRKLIPALFQLFRQDRMPADFAIVGIGTRDYTDDVFRGKMLTALEPCLKAADVASTHQLTRFLTHLHFHRMDQTLPESYPLLKSRLAEIDSIRGAGGKCVYYLATSPSQFGVIGGHLGHAQMNSERDGQGWKRIVIEKPFGYDLASARTLNSQLREIFHENQIYRIDHDLGKETVQNILAFRFANGMFEPLWNRNYVHHVEVTAAESIGIEDRGGYYDGAGALRDMVQNHLLQVLATIAMEPPSRFEANAVRDEKAKVFQSLAPILTGDVHQQVVRGQYLSSQIRGDEVAGYRQEKNVNVGSKTETFVALRFQIDNWRWGGVPFYIRTGKRLPTRVSEAVIHFKRSPQMLFSGGDQSRGVVNQLILRIQPDEGILLKFGMKLPGEGFEIKTVDMDFHYSDLANAGLPEAYERLLLDCMLGDATLYARADAVEACWTFLTPILDAWASDPRCRLHGYPAGTWGPKEAMSLFNEQGEDWRYPCKNLSNDGQYCEL